MDERKWIRTWVRYYADPDVVKEHASSTALRDGEGAIVERLSGAAGQGLRMLDVGVGAGRTTSYFAPITRDYIGIDLSSRMIEACRQRFSDHGWKHVSFVVCDVTDMGIFPDDRFDFVLCSWNCLDLLGGHQARLRALREIARVCTKGGTLYFSSHNLQSLADRRSFRRAVASAASGGLRTMPVDLMRRLTWVAIWRLVNPSRSRLSGADHAELVTARHGTRLLRAYYIRPCEQLRQLRELGFRDPVALTPTGDEIPESRLERFQSGYLYYACAKA